MVISNKLNYVLFDFGGSFYLSRCSVACDECLFNNMFPEHCELQL
jgi:hypothetical protein